jgi:hypothetical protein
MYRIESDWVGICRGVGRGYTGVALNGGGGAGGRCRWAWLDRCLSGVWIYRI